jgi:hypothetical protein
MKKRNKILVGFGFIALITIIGYYVIVPYFLVGSPLPLYCVTNEDVDHHEVVVEIFDSHNKSIFQGIHMMDPKERLSVPKPFLLKFTRPEDSYVYKITLDTKVKKTYETKIRPYHMVDIHLYHKNPVTGDVTPIDILEIVV